MKKIAINTASFATLVLPGVVFAQGIAIVKVVENIGNLLLLILLATAVVFLIIAAFQFIFARGDDSKLKEARTSVLWCLIAVGLGVAAKFLVGFAGSLVPQSR